MKREFGFWEIVTYSHEIVLEADSNERLNEIEQSLAEAIDIGKAEDKESLFELIRKMGGTYEFVEDGSPKVEYE